MAQREFYRIPLMVSFVRLGKEEEVEEKNKQRKKDGACDATFQNVETILRSIYSSLFNVYCMFIIPICIKCTASHMQIRLP
jgi:hypothetical protein